MGASILYPGTLTGKIVAFDNFRPQMSSIFELGIESGVVDSPPPPIYDVNFFRSWETPF